MDRTGKSRKIRTTITLFTTVVSLLSLAFASFAWFSMNKRVDSSGVQMEAEVTPNLMISRDAATLSNSSFLANADDPFSVGFGAAATVLRPATHDDAFAATYLKYNTNPSNVSPRTGVEAGASVLTFEEVPVSGESGPHYYIEHTVYIAADGKAMNDQQLSVSLGKSAPANENMKDNLYAASVDFYMWYSDSAAPGASLSNFKGTLNLAQLDSSNNGQSKDFLTLINRGYIPLNTSGHIAVLMRYYFDGALLKQNSSTAFVRSTEISAEQLGMLVLFQSTDVE